MTPGEFEPLFESYTRALLPRLPASDAIAPRLRESVFYSLFSPGKRLRPRLLISIARQLGLPDSASLPAACALEYFHCGTLVHDDLPCMDNDDFRRGQPSNHKQFDEATALLAGDALLVLAPQAFMDCARSVARPEHFTSALSILLEVMGICGVMSGQALELALPPQGDVSRAELSRLQALKTGVLFSAALGLPAALAGKSDRDISRYRSIGDEIGLAFQIIDDLLDAEQDRSALQKSVLSQLTPSEARAQALACLDRAVAALGVNPVLNEIRAAVPA